LDLDIEDLTASVRSVLMLTEAQERLLEVCLGLCDDSDIV